MKLLFTHFKLRFNSLNKGTRKVLLLIWLSIVFTGISSIFWYNEWVYSLPTPVPLNYQPVLRGQYVNLEIDTDRSKPLFLHFFNPDCPCSKFNIPHFKSLATQYAAKVNFEIVVISKNKNYTADEIRNKFGLTVPVSFDTALATACGVYSTPQAVLLDAKQRLYYRGNYNSSRYCSDESSNYAKMALDSLLNNNHNLNISAMAFKAYGCQLPKCTNQ